MDGRSLLLNGRSLLLDGGSLLLNGRGLLLSRRLLAGRLRQHLGEHLRDKLRDLLRDRLAGVCGSALGIPEREVRVVAGIRIAEDGFGREGARLATIACQCRSTSANRQSTDRRHPKDDGDGDDSD